MTLVWYLRIIYGDLIDLGYYGYKIFYSSLKLTILYNRHI